MIKWLIWIIWTPMSSVPVTHMPGSLTSGFLWSRWRARRSRHSRRMRNPQFYVSGKRPMAAGDCSQSHNDVFVAKIYPTGLSHYLAVQVLTTMPNSEYFNRTKKLPCTITQSTKHFTLTHKIYHLPKSNWFISQTENMLTRGHQCISKFMAIRLQIYAGAKYEKTKKKNPFS